MRTVRNLSFAAGVAATALLWPGITTAEEPLKIPAPVLAQKFAVPIPMQETEGPTRKPELSKDKLAKAAADYQKRKKNNKNAVAKYLFAEKQLAADLRPRAIGWYSKGCLAGGVKLPDNGPAWQNMRLSRNRQWGHPKLIALVKRLGTEAQKYDGWPGLLIGDIAQPRGGPLVTGHASHQVGLDADIWLNPMPDRRLTYREREDISAKTMLDSTSLAVDTEVFTDKHVALIKRAAKYKEVQRIFVHPAIKKALCERAGDDREWLSKVRPLWGHHYHFHIRIYCPNGGCRAQNPVGGGDGCGKEVDNWLKSIKASLKNKPKPTDEPSKWIPPSERRMITMAQLPNECRKVLESPDIEVLAEELPVPKLATKKTAKKE